MGYYSNNTHDWTEQTQETALIGNFSFCMCHRRNFLLVFFFLHHSNSRQDNGHYKFCLFQFVSPVFTSSFSFFDAVFNQKAFFFIVLIFSFFFLLNHWCLKFAQRKRYLTNKCDVILYDLVCMHSVYVCVRRHRLCTCKCIMYRSGL